MKSEHQSNTSLQVLGLNEAQSHAELEAGKECRNSRQEGMGVRSCGRKPEGMGSRQWKEMKREKEKPCLKLKRKQGMLVNVCEPNT